MIVYLHGAHLRGATLEILRKEPLPRHVEKVKDFPFIVVSPLGDGGFEFWVKEEMIDPLFALLDEIQATISVDAKRIYLTGSDMGGNGVWAIGLRQPDYFAALETQNSPSARIGRMMSRITFMPSPSFMIGCCQFHENKEDWECN